VQPAASSPQPAACSLQPAACGPQHAACGLNLQSAPDPKRRWLLRGSALPHRSTECAPPPARSRSTPSSAPRPCGARRRYPHLGGVCLPQCPSSTGRKLANVAKPTHSRRQTRPGHLPRPGHTADRTNPHQIRTRSPKPPQANTSRAGPTRAKICKSPRQAPAPARPAPTNSRAGITQPTTPNHHKPPEAIPSLANSSKAEGKAGAEAKARAERKPSESGGQGQSQRPKPSEGMPESPEQPQRPPNSTRQSLRFGWHSPPVRAKRAQRAKPGTPDTPDKPDKQESPCQPHPDPKGLAHDNLAGQGHSFQHARPSRSPPNHSQALPTTQKHSQALPSTSRHSHALPSRAKPAPPEQPHAAPDRTRHSLTSRSHR
jgi:hypothetical protein